MCIDAPVATALCCLSTITHPRILSKHSKLKRLLGMVRYMMEDTMRVLVDRSLQAYVSYVVSNCASRLAVKSTALVEVVTPASAAPGPNAAAEPSAHAGGAAATAAHRRPPLLQIELQAAKEGTHFHYSVQLDSVIVKFATLFDHAIQKLQVSLQWALLAAVARRPVACCYCCYCSLLVYAA